MSEKRSAVTRIALMVLFAVTAGFTVFGFLKFGLPDLATQHGADVDFVIYYLQVTTGVIFLIGHGVLAWFVWKHTGDDAGGYQPVAARTEWMCALVPVIAMALISEAGVLVFGHPVWQQLYGDLPEDHMEVEVVGKQFEWYVRYPGKDGEFGKTQPELVHPTRNPLGLDKKDDAARDDIISAVLRVPVNTPISLRLRTHDVQHSFNVPSFRIKQDLVPGFPTHTQFTVTQTGDYEIACSELCGLGHYKMEGVVTVLEDEEFSEWLSAQYGWFE